MFTRIPPASDAGKFPTGSVKSQVLTFSTPHGDRMFARFRSRCTISPGQRLVARLAIGPVARQRLDANTLPAVPAAVMSVVAIDQFHRYGTKLLPAQSCGCVPMLVLSSKRVARFSLIRRPLRIACDISAEI